MRTGPSGIASFWAAVSRGIVVVPADFRSSASFVERVQQQVEAKLLLHGAVVDPSSLAVDTLSFEDAASMESEEPLEPKPVGADDVLQILFTSGTTGTPKGVVHRHRNLVSNLAPIRDEIRKYSYLSWPFQPIRILDLLPTSHVFGEFTGVLLPIALGGSAVFMDEVHPSAIIDTIRHERVSILATVPRFLASLRTELSHRFELVSRKTPQTPGIPGGFHRWWRHRDVHNAFGWKFWAILAGGARLPEDDETFWWKVGLALVQGYGLTETSSMVATNHPFRPARGSLGKAVGNQQIKLADDGEILVRGDNVSLEYYGEKAKERDAWLHTGDIGEIGDDGILYYRGRKKDVIVTPDGMNVYPGDVESVLARQPEIREPVVFARNDAVHAAVLLAEGLADEAAADAVGRANVELEPHQRVREWTVWPEPDFPRTQSTFKIKRHEIAARLGSTGSVTPSEAEERGVRALLARQLGRSPDELDAMDEGAELSEELGLSSLDRVELLTTLERELGQELSEAELANVKTVRDLETFAAAKPSAEPPRSPLDGLAAHTRRAPVRWVRNVFRELVTRRLFLRYLPLTIEGDLSGVEPPVLFAANHQSNLDTLALLTALPPRFRRALAPVAQQEYFEPYLSGTGDFRTRMRLGVQYWLALVLVNTFPLSRSGASTRRPMRFAGKLVDEQHSILIFPEGRLSRDGTIEPFQAGVGLLAARLRIPVVPVHLEGLYEIMSYRETWPTRGPVRVRFGTPMRFSERHGYEEAAREIEDAVRKLGAAD